MFLTTFLQINVAVVGLYIFIVNVVLTSNRNIITKNNSLTYFKYFLVFMLGYFIVFEYTYFNLVYNMIIFVYLNNLIHKIWYFYIFSIFYIFIGITFVSIIFTVFFYKQEAVFFIFLILMVFLGSQIMWISNNIFIFFIGYECLLLPSFLILYKHAKTYRCIEAAYAMFFWTQLGSFFILIVVFYFFISYGVSNFTDFAYITNFNITDTNMLLFFLLIGFGVKMPIWPFYMWLPKAHVEASTNFSIFLSGVLVKLAFLGFLKFLLHINIDFFGWYFYAWMLVGICDASQKLFYQTDLKKIVALTTVIEMHWVVFTILHTTSLLYYSALMMFISHALISSLFFILVDCISRRYKTRNVYDISGLWVSTPVLNAIILITNIIFLGFPYTSFFLAEFLFFLALIDINPVIFMIFMLILYFINPIIIFRMWVVVIYGKSWSSAPTAIHDLTKIELSIIVFFLFQLIVLGLYPIINLL